MRGKEREREEGREKKYTEQIYTEIILLFEDTPYRINLFYRIDSKLRTGPSRVRGGGVGLGRTSNTRKLLGVRKTLHPKRELVIRGC